MSYYKESDLAHFNRLVLKFQDEAYTLAWYLFGGDEPAAEAVQAAVLRLSGKVPVDEGDFRVHFLQHVWQQGRSRRVRLLAEEITEGAPGFPWDSLTRRQAQLLVLVSVLGLDYRQTAQVTGCSPQVVMREMAAGYRAVGAIKEDPRRSSTAFRESPSNF